MQKDLLYFNPRSPWGERHFPTIPAGKYEVFQSTLSVGRATRKMNLMPKCHLYFNPRLRGESDTGIQLFKEAHSLSIHALRGESDSKHIQNAAWRFG